MDSHLQILDSGGDGMSDVKSGKPSYEVYEMAIHQAGIGVHDLSTMNVEALRDERNLCSALIGAAEDWMCQINDELMRRGAKI